MTHNSFFFFWYNVHYGFLVNRALHMIKYNPTVLEVTSQLYEHHHVNSTYRAIDSHFVDHETKIVVDEFEFVVIFHGMIISITPMPWHTNFFVQEMKFYTLGNDNVGSVLIILSNDALQRWLGFGLDRRKQSASNFLLATITMAEFSCRVSFKLMVNYCFFLICIIL